MTEEAPQVSVIVVAYNAGRHLAPALTSILQQQGVSLELVLVDNASTDGAVDRWIEQEADSRVRLLKLPENRYHAGGLNAALPLCRGSLVAMMDADDLSLPGRLATQASFLQANPAIDLVGCAAEAIDADNRPLGSFFSVVDEHDARAFLRFAPPFLLNTAMARRAFWASAGWRDEFRWAHDFDFLTCVAPTARLICLPAILYHYRIHPGSGTVSHAVRQLISSSFVRLAAARRAEGRTEQRLGLAREHDEWMKQAKPEQQVYAVFAERFAAEGFDALALMYARRAVGAGFSARALIVAAKSLVRASRKNPEERRFLFRLALLGPAHALAVQSLPPQASRWRQLFASNRGVPESAPTDERCV